MAHKKTKVKAAPRVKRGGKIVGPSFEGWETWTGQAFSRFRQNAHMFYYENYKLSDLTPSVWLWMADNGYTKEQIKQAKAAPGAHSVSTTTAICCKLLEDGCPDYNEEHNIYWESCKGTSGNIKPLTEYIKKDVDTAIKHGKDVVEEVKQEETEKARSPQPTIQERITEQAATVATTFDEWLDTLFYDAKNFDSKSVNVSSHLIQNNVSQAHARKIKNFYDREMQDFVDLQNMPTSAQLKKMTEEEQDWHEQLKEGYAHLKKAEISKIINVYQSIIDACDMIIEKSKATRKTRKPKQYSASKLIEKLKYKKSDEKYSVVSVNPTEIIQANELWVFNTKTRKLGKYIAKNVDPKGLARDGSGLTVKGTSIQDFDENLSVQKTLRKPDEQLREFKAAGKVALRKFMDSISTTDTKLNGRINVDTVLLRVN